MSAPIPWDQPGANPLADLDAMLKVWADAPYRPHEPLLSPRCGLEGHINHGACLSAICQCECHLEKATRHVETRRDDTGRTVVSREVAAKATGRHPDVIRRAVTPVACDVATRSALLDLAELEERLAAMPTRRKRETHGCELVSDTP